MMDTINSLKKLTQSDILIGNEIQKDVYSSNGTLLARSGMSVQSPEAKAKLLSAGHVHGVQAKQVSAKIIADPKRDTIFQPLFTLSRRLGTFLAKPHAQDDFEQKVLTAADEVISLVEKCKDGCLAFIILFPKNDYSTAHSLDTAILLAIMLSTSDLQNKYKRVILAAALCMNISMIDAQNEMSAQEKPLSLDQRMLINSHPLESAQILRDIGIVNELWLHLVEMHHETGRGDGYPRSLEASQVLPHARMIHMADVVCAALSGRSYRVGLHATTVLKRIYRNEDAKFDQSWVVNLIKQVGIYPPGSFVKLQNEEVAVVLKATDEAAKPYVASIRKSDGPVYAEAIRRDTGRSEFKIVSPVRSDQVKAHFTFFSPLWQV